MALVSIRILPWLVKELGFPEDEAVLLQEEIQQGETMGELLARLALRYRRFGEIVFDVGDQRIHEQVAVILNGRLLVAHGGLTAQIKGGDQITLLPGFSGG